MKGLVDRAIKESCSVVKLKKEIFRRKLMATCLEHKKCCQGRHRYKLAEVVGQGSGFRASGIRSHAESVQGNDQAVLGPNPCSRCSKTVLENTPSYFDHYVAEHLKTTTTLTSLYEVSSLLTSRDPDLLSIIKLCSHPCGLST